LACFAPVLALFLFGFSLRHQTSLELLLAPSWERRVLVATYAMPVIPAFGFIFIALRKSATLKRALPLVGVLLLSVAGGAGVTVAGANWLFGPNLKATAKNADGREAGIWFDHFLGCDWELFVAPPHQALAPRVDRRPVECNATGTPSVVWLPDGGAELALDGGTEPAPWNFGFGWN
jgi:hypothetical protein